MSISQPFEELQSWNSELKLITPISITGSHFGTMAAILDFFFLDFFLGGEEGEGAEGPQQGPKGPGGPKGPQPSAGARRRAAVGRPNLLV